MANVTVYRAKAFTKLSRRARFRLWWRRWRMPPEIAVLEGELARREMDALINGTSGHRTGRTTTGIEPVTSATSGLALPRKTG